MTNDDLLLPFERMLEDVCGPQTVREIESGGSPDVVWNAFEQSGFLDALVPEAAGGAGLSPRELCPLFMALGKYAVPLPVGETMLARALLADRGQTATGHPIHLDTGAMNFVDGSPHRWRLGETGAGWTLTNDPDTRCAPSPRLMRAAAALRSCIIAGAADHTLEMTVRYASERVQFGKPIAKQQAVQQQLAVMAELTVACRVAAQIGCAGELPPALAAAAIAKQVTGNASGNIIAIAHAVHGAIGMSEEYDLNLYTRRMHRERVLDGSADYWARQLGGDRLAKPAGPTLDYVRQALG